MDVAVSRVPEFQTAQLIPASALATQAATASNLTYFLCVDGGGSSCTAVIISSLGATSVGEAGPCNCSTIGIEATISVISSAIRSALSGQVEIDDSETISSVPISSAWIAIAGYDRPSIAPVIDSAIAQLLGIPVGPRLTVSSDVDLLSVKAAEEPLIDSAIVLVAGTGSVAMSYTRNGSKLSRSARIGGWGPLLGDDGSGFAVGREALRVALRTSDLIKAGLPVQDISTLSKAIFEYFEKAHGQFHSSDLLSHILIPPTLATTIPPSSKSSSPTRSIARAAEIVFFLGETDDQAMKILERGSISLSEMVAQLLRGQNMSPARTTLIMAGGLLNNGLYNGMVQKELAKRGVEFKCAMTIEVPALEGARFLANKKDDI